MLVKETTSNLFRNYVFSGLSYDVFKYILKGHGQLPDNGRPPFSDFNTQTCIYKSTQNNLTVADSNFPSNLKIIELVSA